MALAWKAGWVHALTSSNLVSSAQMADALTPFSQWPADRQSFGISVHGVHACKHADVTVTLRSVLGTRGAVLAGLASVLLILGGCSGTSESPSATGGTASESAAPTEGTSSQSAATAGGSATASSTGASGEKLTDVSPSDYRSTVGDGGYFFVSPSGNLSCGFIAVDGEQSTGCQAWVIVSNLPKCNDPQGTSSPMISFTKGSAATADCSSQGIFGADQAKVLQYGQRITVGGVACTSRQSGVTCVETATGRGFKAAREGFAPVG